MTNSKILATTINHNFRVSKCIRRPVRDTDGSRNENSGNITKLNQPRQLSDFKIFRENGASILLRYRYLGWGEILLVVGPTGVGKSSLVIQIIISWSLGRDCFGIKPARPLRTLIIQAENNDGDIAEMRDGIFQGLELSEAEQYDACRMIRVITVDADSGMHFGKRIEKYLKNSDEKIDLIVIDPAFAYLRGDASSQSNVTEFLRQIITPVIRKYGCGAIIVHHTNKPPSGRQNSGLSGSNLAYLGSGSIEWANSARALIGLSAIGKHDEFDLILGKRGKRVGWVDKLGQPIYSKRIAHHRNAKVIFWREVTEEQKVVVERAENVNARLQTKKPSLEEFMELFPESSNILLKAGDIRSEFEKRNWDVNSYVKLRDEAVKKNLLATARGSRGSVWSGRPEAIEDYRRGGVNDQLSSCQEPS